MSKSEKGFDVNMRVTFCEEHKKVFENDVRIKLNNGTVGYDASRLVSLLKDSEICIECIWCTTFGKVDKK